MKKIIISFVFTLLAISLFAASPIVSNVVATPETGKVTITYHLQADDVCEITVLISNDGGTTYRIFPCSAALDGDVGAQIPPGNNTISWYPAADNVEVGDYYKVKVIARDNADLDASHFTSFIRVEGGSFEREFEDDTYTITVSSFYIDKYETTQADYEAVMGYNPNAEYDPENPEFEIVGADYPVYHICWVFCIEYCNWRSIQEGLEPCYYYSDNGDNSGVRVTNPDDWPENWKSEDANLHTNIKCNWDANGYRLPTLAEWLFAALGGNDSHGYSYSGSNDPDEVAWYDENSGVEWYPGPDGKVPHIVGTKNPNELGIHDMSGNVTEYCWDCYEEEYLVGDQVDPKGPEGDDCWIKGDCYYHPIHPIFEAGGLWDCFDCDDFVGIRCVRNAP